VNLLSGHRVRYYNGAAIHLRQNVMRWHSTAHGFGFQADLIVRLLDMGASYIEVPVVPGQRNAGTTKAFRFKNLASVGHTLLEILIRRIAHMLYSHEHPKLASEHNMYQTPAFDQSTSSGQSAELTADRK
jgi:hypothetical protein